jgi:hypothetical protein
MMEILDFYIRIGEVSSVVGYVPASLDDWYPTFRNNILVSSSRVEQSKKEIHVTRKRSVLYNDSVIC